MRLASMGRTRLAIVTVVSWLSIAAHGAPPPPVEQPPSALPSWLNPSTWPVIPVPEIDVDPYTGTTVGIIPTLLQTGEHNEIRRIIAPDIIYNGNFGFGARARVFAYPSADTQWSIVGGGKQRVESEFAALYETGRLRLSRWSFTTQAIYDRSGTPRFYGFGNRSRLANQTVYTDQQQYLRVKIGYNFNRAWQLAYTVSPMKVKILGSSLASIPSIESRFPGLRGIGTTHALLNRFSLTYDTRDDLTFPTRGVALIAYGGLASRGGLLNDSLYSEAGGDARFYWSPTKSLTVAAHVDIRYMPAARNAPFWALSSIGGVTSTIGGPQTLRGYGTSRFTDRNSFSANLELRQRIASIDAVSTHIELEVAPFIDVGRVFARSSTWPISNLHSVVGVGFRGIARPSVVGYVDIGRGSEGFAVFTGINYPF